MLSVNVFLCLLLVYFVYYKISSWLWRFDHKIYFTSEVWYFIISQTCVYYFSTSSHQYPPTCTTSIAPLNCFPTNILCFLPVRSTLHTATTVSFRNPTRYQYIYIFSLSVNICIVLVTVITTNAWHKKLFTIWPQLLISASYFTCHIYQSSSLWIYNPKPKNFVHVYLSLCSQLNFFFLFGIRPLHQIKPSKVRKLKIWTKIL